ncbi:DUF4340 domain-containing protein [Zestomonas carbonaria]|uniref:DUF4340 domain-containing protein n=1 Tax=Zestomonas carbonaria TaxID=2762745 RepID=A0A7U7EQY1_9GAMM|nr:DUF4340 domain-containing protein [Pseudomonas carbonaria]CAD5109087.1 hypothetical protein PSEWESI4_03383 [Pseudomonas carbonaria]
MGRKSLSLLALLILVLGGAYFWLQRPAPVSTEREPLLPALQGRVAEVAGIEVAGPGQPLVRLARKEQTWVMPAKADYPAEPGAVGSLLRALVEARKVEAKTSNPQLHGQLGLAEQGEQQATRVKLELPGNQLLTVLVGKPAQQGSGQFVRLADDNQAWLIDKSIDLPLDELQWLDRRVAAIPFESVQQVEVRYANGETLTVYRDKAEEPNFQVKQLPAGKKPPYEAAANGMATLFGRLDFADAAPLDQVKFKEPAALRYELRTFDGGSLRGALYEQGEQYWLTLAERDKLADEVLPGKADWAYRVEQHQYRALGTALKEVLAKK